MSFDYSKLKKLEKHELYKDEFISNRGKNIRTRIDDSSVDSFNKRNMSNIKTRKLASDFGQEINLPKVNDVRGEFKKASDIKLPVYNKPKPIERKMTFGNVIGNVASDVIGLGKLTGLGATSGIKQVGNYLENATMYNNKGLDLKQQQAYFANPSVNEVDKAVLRQMPYTKKLAENQNLLSMQDRMKNLASNEDVQYNVAVPNEKPETNLVRKAIQDSINEDSQKIQDEQSKLSNPVSRKLGEIAPSIGQTLPGMALNAIFPLVGGAMYYIPSASGSYIDDAKARGMTDEQSFVYGSVMGALEGASEAVITGQMASKAKNAFTGKAISKKVLDSYGFNIFENAVQEAVMEPAQELVAGIVGDKADWSNIGERMFQSGFNGALMGAISNGVTYGLEKSGGLYNKIKNGQKITEAEYQGALQENIDRFGKDIVEQSMRNGAREVYDEIGKVANSQNSLYNNIESESGRYGERTIPKGNQGVLGQLDTRLQQNSKSQQNQRYTKAEYEQWERSIRPIEYNKLTNEQRSVSNNVKRQYNKNIVFFDGKNNQGYLGGASLTNINKIYVDINSVENFGMNRIINHEVLESDIVHNQRLKEEIINPVIEKIINDNNFKEQKSKFWEGQNGEKPNDYAIAKDILCDRFAEMKTGEKLDYNNVLSQETNMTIDYAIDNFEKQIDRTNLPIADKYVKENTVSGSTIQDETIAPMSEIGKQRKHYKSIVESQYMTDEAKAIAKELLNSDTYVPESNVKQLEMADRRIENSGADSELNSLMGRAISGDKITADDIAVGERLIQYYSKTGDKIKLRDAIQTTAMSGTVAGQTVQALALLNHQTPEGQAVWLQRSVEKMNNDLKKQRGANAEQFNLTPDMVEKIVNSKNKQELQNNLNEIYEELGRQVSKTMLQKIDSWRYFCMLANPRTHIRNIVGNTAMARVQSVKNKVAGSIESVVGWFAPDIERSHTIVPASKEVKKFAKNDVVNVADRLGLNENKYNPKTRLENSMRTFKSDVLENTLGKLFDLNNNALEAEDGWGLKAGYVKALSEYITANKFDVNNMSDSQLNKARNYAVEQAQEATFHQASSLATALNQFSNKNGLTKFISDSILPFKKTPINVAKTGLEYSPVGLVKSIIYDTSKLRKGNISVNKYIDNISKGLTGTGIAVLGYALANAGILKASGSDDDDKAKYDEDRGNQTYSIRIGDSTYSLDWVAPSGIPLFVGAKVFETMQNDREKNTSSSDDESVYSKAIMSATNVLDAFTNSMNPMTEMSMLSGLTSALKSYDQDNTQMIASIGTNAVKSYVNQFVPTALGQVAKTADEYERSTTSTKTGVLPKAIDSTKNQIMSKIPGLRQMLPTKSDIWGNDIKQDENVWKRALNNAVVPWTKKKISETAVDWALNSLYEETGEGSILPDVIDKSLTINKQRYVMTADEYAKYRKQYAKSSFELIDELIGSSEYRSMSNEQRQEAIVKAYNFAREEVKIDYAKSIGQECKSSSLYDVMKYIDKNGGNQSDYLSYVAKTKELDKEKDKTEFLASSKYSAKTKKAIYVNTMGKDDELYSVLARDNINVSEYLKYKSQEFTSDKKDDGTTKGKSISGSKKNKVVDYINDTMKITPEQRILLLATQYDLNTGYKHRLVKYVKGLNLTQEENKKLYEKLKGFDVYKNGDVKY